MNYTRRTRRNEYYLDVSDFILTDPRQVIPSPRRTPLQMNQTDVQQLNLADWATVLTPSNLPLIIQVGGVELSPYFSVNGPNVDIQFYDFTLEIPEENEQNEFSQDQDQLSDNQNHRKIKRPQPIQQQPVQQEAQQEQAPQYQQMQISRYNLHYFNQAISELKKMKATDQEMRQFVMQYIVEENGPEELIEKLTFKQLVQIALSNLRPVGSISWLQRKSKVNKYIQKKKKRVWKKKISYDCRKRVADNRLRIKGKFVTKKQACNILGVQQLSEQDLKVLLEAKGSKYQ